MTAGYYLSTSWSQHFHQISLVCSRKTQKKAKKNPEETQGNKRDFRVVSVCRLPQFFRLLFCLIREFPVVFPPYITMVWYLFLVKGGIIRVLWLFWIREWGLNRLRS